MVPASSVSASQFWIVSYTFPERGSSISWVPVALICPWLNCTPLGWLSSFVSYFLPSQSPFLFLGNHFPQINCLHARPHLNLIFSPSKLNQSRWRKSHILACDPFSVVIFDHTIFVLNMLTYQAMIGNILFPNLQFQTIPDETFVPAASVCGPDAMGTFPALIVCSDLVLSSSSCLSS